MIFSIFAKFILIAAILIMPASPVGGKIGGKGPVVFASRNMNNLIVQKGNSAGPEKIRDMDIVATARSIAVMDRKTGNFLFEKNVREPSSVASITKLMSAYVFLEMTVDGRREVVMEAADDTVPVRIDVSSGDRLTVKDLVYSGLVGSANNAVNAMVRHVGLTPFEFAQRMNAKAREWGLLDTVFVDPTGLDPENRSTAGDIAKMVSRIMENRAIREITAEKDYVFTTEGGRAREITVENTDKLIGKEGSGIRIMGGKTGYLEEAGYCLAVLAENGKGNEVVAVVLGSETSDKRFSEMEEVLEETYRSYLWK